MREEHVVWIGVKAYTTISLSREEKEGRYETLRCSLLNYDNFQEQYFVFKDSPVYSYCLLAGLLLSMLFLWNLKI